MASPPFSALNPSYGDSEDERREPYFLDACSLCKEPLGDRDVYMYKGNIPFCSVRCRKKQIDRDEAKETSLKLSSITRKLTKPETAMASLPPSATNILPFFFNAGSDDEQQEPKLPEVCYLCKAPLRHNRDTYVCQGNRRFCSEGCRKKKIHIDEAKEGDLNISSAARNLTKPETDGSAS